MKLQHNKKKDVSRRKPRYVLNINPDQLSREMLDFDWKTDDSSPTQILHDMGIKGIMKHEDT